MDQVYVVPLLLMIRFFEDYDDSAGEINHIIWDRNSSVVCNVCGKNGCLESLINTKVIKETNDWAGAFEKLARVISSALVFLSLDKLLLAGSIFENSKMEAFRRFSH